MAPMGLVLTSVVIMTTVVMSGCEAKVEGVPEGALARVGDVVIEGDRLATTQAQLDAYGQARFRGPEGQRALVDAIIQEELLGQEALDAGFGNDPRVEWAVYEELAALQLAAMLERRLPRADVAADTLALRARYDAALSSFETPERRRMRVVRVDTWEDGEADIARIQSGAVELEDIGDVVRTPLMKRDDHGFPAYHQWLFDPALEVGDLVPSPVLSGQIVLVGAVEEIEVAGHVPFEDPEVQERLVEAEREHRLVAIEAELMAELAQRFPEGN